jgi:hypothetical protein
MKQKFNKEAFEVFNLGLPTFERLVTLLNILL